MLELFQYDFMVRAFSAGLIIGTIAPLIGLFLVVKRYSLLADTLSHVSLVGVALGVLLHFNPMFGALLTSCLTAFGIEKLRESRKIFGESILALFLSGSLAVAILLFNLVRGQNVSIVNYLFGSITTVSSQDILLIGSFGCLVLFVTIVLFKKLFLVSYDEDLAKASGLPVKTLNITLMLLAAVTVSLSMQVVGTLLMGALMVIPVLAATQFGASFFRTAIYATLLSLSSVIIGLFASFYLNLPSGGAIVVVTIILFALSFLVNKRRYT